MQFKLATFATLFAAAATLAAAIATPAKRDGGDDAPSDQCNTGELVCCDSIQAASDPTAASLISLVGAVVSGVDALVGVTCSGPSAIGISGTSCTTQPICCTDNSFNGIVAVGCTAVNGNA